MPTFLCQFEMLDSRAVFWYNVCTYLLFVNVCSVSSTMVVDFFAILAVLTNYNDTGKIQ